jgi:hypothetical protein
MISMLRPFIPFLHLLHSVDEEVGGWVSNGPSGLIADNLIAQGRPSRLSS